MSALGFALKLFGGRGRRKGTPARKPARARLEMESLEERSLLSTSYLQTNLVSDIPGLAQVTDPTLMNPWGISLSPNGGAFWVSSNNGGVSELYLGDVNGNPINSLFKVIIPGGSPTGQVFNVNQPLMANGNSNAFSVTDGMHTAPAVFLFATETGEIIGWNPGVGQQIPLGNGTISDLAEVGFRAADGAVYKGLAAGDVGAAHFLYAADFHNGKIDVIDGQFHKVALGANGFGTFTDPNLPAGFAPFNVANIGGKLFVSYAKPDANDNSVDGAGNGFVDVFDTSGHFLQRLATQGTLNSPWGMALAPANFGTFSGDLLVGNFGDGTINAYNPTTGAFLGQMKDANGNTIHIDRLWGLAFGNGVSSGATNTLFFTAGLNAEQDGLFGSLQATVPGGSNARFVDRIYQDLLGRQADAGGLAFWTGQMDQGMTRAQVVSAIENTVEFQTGVVQKAYQQFLHRAADQGGLSFWVSFLQQGNTVEQMEAGLVGSAEYFQNREGGTNAGFLATLFQDALGRAIDMNAQNFFTQQLAGGASLGQVAGQVFASTDFQQNLVQGDYRLFLNRAADNAGLAFFTNAFQQGQTDQQIAAAIAASDELFAGV
jgi:uncharacterized protein (TIGR03118 family)